MVRRERRGGVLSARERGAVTAETAMVLPILFVVTMAMAWLLSVGVAQVRSIDAAREAARAVARGDSPGDAVALAKSIAPEGVSVTVTVSGARVTATASGGVTGPTGFWSSLPGADIDVQAVALMEEQP